MQVTRHDKDTFLNRGWRLQRFYKIRDEHKKLVNLKFNCTQTILFNEASKKGFRGIREFDLKGRKQGVSTFWLIVYLDDTIMVPNTNSGIIAHKKDDVQKLFRIVKLAYDKCPNIFVLENGREWHKPKALYDNKNELVFEGINSTIYVALDVRGGTPNNLHISEAAHIRDQDKIRASLASVPNVEYGTNITIESTANGVGDYFQEGYDEAMMGKNGYTARFFPWFLETKNTLRPPEDFKPTKEENELKAKVFKQYGVILNDSQLYWWRRKKAEQKKLMNQEFPTFVEDAFLFAGNLAFDEEAVQGMATKEPMRQMPIQIESRDPSSGKMRKKTYNVQLWQEPKPGRQYILGADPAEGAKRDDSVAEVYDRVTLEQVAEFTSDEITPVEFGTLVDKLGRFFNTALAVPERNNHGHTVIQRLVDLRYPNIFCMVIFDEKLNRKTKKLGWEQRSDTRDVILDQFEDLVLNKTVKINSAILKGQITTFITDETGKRQAKSGKKDDTILASAIALKVARMPRTSFAVFNLD